MNLSPHSGSYPGSQLLGWFGENQRGGSQVIPAGEECGEVLQIVGACPVMAADAPRLDSQCLEVCCGRRVSPLVGPLGGMSQTCASMVLIVLVGLWVGPGCGGRARPSNLGDGTQGH